MSRANLVNEILSQISSIKRIMHGYTYACMDGSSITSGQLGILLSLKQNGPQTTHKLSKQLVLTPGAISQIVDSLSDRGYIIRTAHENDRRSHDLSLSLTGQQQIEAIEIERLGFMTAIVKNLSDDELDLLISAHHKILQAMRDEVKQTERKR